MTRAQTRPLLLITVLLSAALLLAAWLTSVRLAQARPDGMFAPASQGGETAWVSLLAQPGEGLESYFSGPVYRQPVGGLVRLAGRVPLSRLGALKARPQAALVFPQEAPLPPEPNPDTLFYPALDLAQRGADRIQAIQAQARSTPPRQPRQPEGWYENDTQGVREVWNTYSLSGAGVLIGVLDSGVDFGNPALAGSFAVQPATISGTQAYAGWPITFDDRSLSDYLADPGRAWPQGWGWYVNTGYQITGSGVFTFTDPLTATRSYTVPGTANSYTFGYHPDTLLEGAALLVADELPPSGQYDAVYMDLDFDGNFETRLDQADPVAQLDLSGDGVADISGGLLAWISDGINPPPGAEAVYGPGAPPPPAGQMVVLMLDDIGLSGGGHGTMVASTAVGNDGGAFLPAPRVASFYTTSYGALVQGPAPQARIIAAGNLYAGGSLEAYYLFSVLGLDGAPGTGDEAHIVNLSFGDGSIDNDGWDWESRYVAYLNYTYGPHSPLFVHSAGNGGFGYGTLLAPSPPTALVVGLSTQFGTYNAWGISETVSLAGRVNRGDVASVSGRGPGADGLRAVDLLANGLAGTGAYPLNVSGDGRAAYVHWTGSSRSAPVVGGIAALVYQAYRQARGQFPAYDEGRQLLMNGARHAGSDPLAQGAGVVYALRSVQLALQEYGLQVSPPLATPGSYRGQVYPAFSGGVQAGQAYTLSLNLSNPGSAAITATLGASALAEIARYTATVATSIDTATNYGLGAPDYALNLTPWVQAHPAADLMVVRLQIPFEHFDSLPPTPATPDNWWWLMAYNWWNDHANSAWWTDLDGDQRVDLPAEIDSGDEWMRFDYARLRAPVEELRISQPYTRSLGAGSTGIWAGAAHMLRAAGDNRTTLQFEVIFYQRQPWPVLTLPAQPVIIAPGEQASLQAGLHVPAGAPPGLYQGFLTVADPGRSDLQPGWRAHTTQVPVTFQVWPGLTGPVRLGDGQPGPELYSNHSIGGGFAWLGPVESGDWRFFGFDLTSPPPGSVLLLRNRWAGYPTDLDSLVFAPALDIFSQADPAHFGPYSLAWAGGSLRSGTRPNLNFQTATGTTEEWIAAPAQDGLHVLAHQAVLFAGLDSRQPFTTDLGLASAAPWPVNLQPAACPVTCSFQVSFQSGLDLPRGLAGRHGLAWITPQPFSASLQAGAAITHLLTLSEAYYRVDLEVASLSGAAGLSVELFDDSGMQPGAWDAGDARLSGSPVLQDGQGWTVPSFTIGKNWLVVTAVGPGPGETVYRLDALPYALALDHGLAFAGLPAQVAAGETVTFTVQALRPPAEGQRGLLVFGPADLPAAINLPVIAESLADLQVGLRGAAVALPGEPLTLTVVYTNAGPSPAGPVTLSLDLPPELAASQPASLSLASLPPGGPLTWTLTATLSAALPPGSPLTLSAEIRSPTRDPRPGDNAASLVILVGQDAWRTYLPLIRR